MSSKRESKRRISKGHHVKFHTNAVPSKMPLLASKTLTPREEKHPPSSLLVTNQRIDQKQALQKLISFTATATCDTMKKYSKMVLPHFPTLKKPLLVPEGHPFIQDVGLKLTQTDEIRSNSSIEQILQRDIPPTFYVHPRYIDTQGPLPLAPTSFKQWMDNWNTYNLSEEDDQRQILSPITKTTSSHSLEEWEDEIEEEDVVEDKEEIPTPKVVSDLTAGTISITI